MDFYLINHEARLEDIEKFDYPNRKIGVIAHIENDKGEILLQQRGVKSRDENGLYEDIGGKVDSDDLTFQDAIIREIKEEAGDDIKLEFQDHSIGIYHAFKNDIHSDLVTEGSKYLSKSIKNNYKC